MKDGMEKVRRLKEKCVSLFSGRKGAVLAVVLMSALLVGAFIFWPRNAASGRDSSGHPAVVDAVIDPEDFIGTLLVKSEDMGQKYVDETLFIGDSNTYRFMMYGKLTLKNCIGIVGIGVNQAVSEKCVKFMGKPAVTIPNAVAIMQPRRIVLTFGTNDYLSKTDNFVKSYKTLIDAIKKAYPYADIIINAVPPVAKEREYVYVTMNTIDEFNLVLAMLAEDSGCYFLNSSEALVDPASGYMLHGFTLADGIHLNMKSTEAFFEYFRTHGLKTADRRVSRTPVPERDEPEPYIIKSDIPYYGSSVELEFHVNDETMGTVEGDSEQSVKAGRPAASVTAVPLEGYRFVEWRCSAGTITDPESATLTFSVPSSQKESILITAVFEPDGNVVSITGAKSGTALLRLSDTAKAAASLVVPVGGKVAVVVTPAEHFKLEGIYAGTEQVLSPSAFTLKDGVLVASFTPTAPVALTAEFVLNYDPMSFVTVSPKDCAAVSASVSEDGAAITYTCAVADAEHAFKHWLVNGGAVSASPTLTVQKADGLSVTAVIHTHSWNDGAENPAATCLQAGKTDYICTECGAKKTVTVPATDAHIWNGGVETKPATCGADGVALFTCTACGAAESRPIPATGAHIWNGGVETKPATCGADGSVLFTCTACGAAESRPIPATGNHVYGGWYDVSDATETEYGKHARACACGHVQTENDPLKPPTGSAGP